LNRSAVCGIIPATGDTIQPYALRHPIPIQLQLVFLRMPKRATTSQPPGDKLSKKQKTSDTNEAAPHSQSISHTPQTVLVEEAGYEEGPASPSNVQDADETSENDETGAASRVSTDTDSKTKTEKKKTKKPPVSDGFADFQKDITVPPSNPFWGIKPMPGDPQPDPIQPSARSSNGQTNPPLWEDRGYRYKRGSRFVKYFGPIPPDDLDELEDDLDQEDLHVVKMVDMRPKSKEDPTPKRVPVVYCYGKTPKDWTNMQAIKALNDRRYQAIDRTTLDRPWKRIEREYLASLLRETPDASIWDLTERHNDRFMGKDFTDETGFDFANLSTGRTVESVRYEYMTYKPLYDAGKVPEAVRWRGDPSLEAKAIRASGRAETAFGPPSRALELAHDAEYGGEEDEDASMSTKESKRTTKKSSSSQDSTQTDPFSGQEKLEDDEERLLELAGAYGSDPQAASPGMLPNISTFVDPCKNYWTNQIADGHLEETEELADDQIVSVAPLSPVKEQGTEVKASEETTHARDEADNAAAENTKQAQDTCKEKDSSDAVSAMHIHDQPNPALDIEKS
jgi:hypothetical protein